MICGIASLPDHLQCRSDCLPNLLPSSYSAEEKVLSLLVDLASSPGFVFTLPDQGSEFFIWFDRRSFVGALMGGMLGCGAPRSRRSGMASIL